VAPITWEGNPRAQLNLRSRIQNDGKSCSFIDNSSFNAKVPVEVVIGIRGDLTSPEPDFNIEFPTVSNVLKSEIQYKLNGMYDKLKRCTYYYHLVVLSPEGESI
jgi:hypothetical protein